MQATATQVPYRILKLIHDERMLFSLIWRAGLAGNSREAVVRLRLPGLESSQYPAGPSARERARRSRPERSRKRSRSRVAISRLQPQPFRKSSRRDWFTELQERALK